MGPELANGNDLLKQRLTIGSAILIVLGAFAIGSLVAGLAWTTATWTKELEGKIGTLQSSNRDLQGQIKELKSDVSTILIKLEEWHRSNPEKRTDAGPTNTP